jgi:type I restriction enzyme S subunit
VSTINNLPTGWILKPLGEACRTIKGKKPKDTGPASVERTVPYINIKSFETGQPVEFSAQGNYPACKRDDVLIVWDGARAGLTGRAVAGYIGSTLAKIYSDETNNQYLFYFLQAQYGLINSRTKGVGIPHVDPSIFNNIPFPIAPPDQQKRIVAEIEKQFSRLDEAIADLKRVKANLKRYKAAVLKAAVEGSLVETEAELARREGRSYETGTQLLQRILETRRSQWNGKGKYKEPGAPDTTNLPELPDGWVWTSLDSLIVDGPQNGIYLPKTLYGTGHPILRIDDYQQDWIRPVTELQRVRAKPEDVATYSLRSGDIVINRVNSPSHLGKVAIWEKTAEMPLFESNMMRAALSSGVVPLYVATYLRSLHGRARLTKQAKWAVNQASINQQDVCGTPVPLPSLEEQNRIVAEVDMRLSALRKTEALVDANFQRTNHLRQSILSQAFASQ